MEILSRLLERVLPLLLLLGTGRSLGYWGVLKPASVEGMKKLVVSLALPSILFLSFLNIELQTTYVPLAGVILAVCLGMFFIGRLGVKYIPGMPRQLPFLLSGFEYGMFALSLFVGAFGMKAVGYIAVVDLGHECFIWLAYVPLLFIANEGSFRPVRIVRMVATSPILIAIFLGLCLNGAGVAEHLPGLPLVGPILDTLEMLGSLTVPLILLIVGYGLRVDRAVLGPALRVVILRLVCVLPLALALNRFVLREMLGLAPPFETALMVMFLMPPPFILPLFLKTENAQEEQVITGVLAVHAIVSICLFVGYLLMVPEL